MVDNSDTTTVTHSVLTDQRNGSRVELDETGLLGIVHDFLTVLCFGENIHVFIGIRGWFSFLK